MLPWPLAASGSEGEGPLTAVSKAAQLSYASEQLGSMHLVRVRVRESC